jgi:hypothetical protein
MNEQTRKELKSIIDADILRCTEFLKKEFPDMDFQYEIPSLKTDAVLKWDSERGLIIALSGCHFPLIQLSTDEKIYFQDYLVPFIEKGFEARLIEDRKIVKISKNSERLKEKMSHNQNN